MSPKSLPAEDFVFIFSYLSIHVSFLEALSSCNIRNRIELYESLEHFLTVMNQYGPSIESFIGR